MPTAGSTKPKTQPSSFKSVQDVLSNFTDVRLYGRVGYYTLCLKKFPPLNSVTLSNRNRSSIFSLPESVRNLLQTHTTIFISP